MQRIEQAIERFAEDVSSSKAVEEIGSDFPSTKSKTDPNKMMRCIEWYGKTDVRFVERPKVMVTDPEDAVVKITCSTICGSDLHMYHHEFPRMEIHDVVGHEAVGVVESVGPGVKNIKVGDRVVVSSVISCGKCEYCQKGCFSSCDRTNPSKLNEQLSGHRISGLMGYSHLTGGYEGCQSEFVRVPIADVNLLPVKSNISDEKLIFLADIGCTAWWGTEWAEVNPGETVCIFGAGPVGLLTMMWCKYRGAARIIMIDKIPFRLDVAKANGAEVVNLNEVKDIVNTMKEICPGGPDKCIEAVGFRYAQGFLHKLERALYLETDTSEIINACIQIVKKCGIVAVIGDYMGKCNGFEIGNLFMKSVTLRPGVVHPQAVWKKLLEIMEKGEVDPTFVISHRMNLEETPKAYKMFDQDKNTTLKVILKPSHQSSA